MKGILPDNNVRGQVDYLVALMQAEPWRDFWTGLGLALLHFPDVGLSPAAGDLEVWQKCQSEQLVLITDNRNLIGPESLEAVIRVHNQPHSLPVFTIADVDKLNSSRVYAEQIVERLLDCLMRIDDLRGCGRLYLP